MSVSKKQQACVTRYVNTHYDTIKLFVDKGKRDEIKAAAQAANQSTNAYITQAVFARMSAEGFTSSAADAPTSSDE